MKFLKKITWILSVALVLCSCSDEEKTEVVGAETISLSTDILQVSKDGGTPTVTVKSSGAWRLSGVCDWARPSATSGKDGDVVTFTVDANNKDEKQSATFKFFTGGTVAPLLVEINPNYVMELVSDPEMTISKNEGTLLVKLNTNIANPIVTYGEGTEEWLKLEKESSFMGKTALTFKVAENKAYRDRRGAIRIASPLEGVPMNVDVQVTQKQTDAIIVDQTTLIHDLAARTISFQLKYNVEYSTTITKGSDWITPKAATEPQTGDEGLSTVTLSYDLSEAADTRGGNIMLYNTASSITSNVAVVQKDPAAQLVEIPDEHLRKWVTDNRWILPIAGSQCLVLEAGKTAVRLRNTSYNISFRDLTGIGNFPNLTSLELSYCTYMEKMDISELHNVSTLTFSGPRSCREFNLGDNPIKSFNAGGQYAYSNVESVKIISSQLETVDMRLNSWYSGYDKITSIDVSECPALTTFYANRSDKISTIYLKTGQVIPNLIKNENTKIVYK